MGPQPFGCGRAQRHALGLIAPKLQWGRNLSVAEGSSVRARWGPIHGFNGAATFRLRKAAPEPEPEPEPSASMGPQPFGCGRPMIGQHQ